MSDLAQVLRAFDQKLDTLNKQCSQVASENQQLKTYIAELHQTAYDSATAVDQRFDVLEQVIGELRTHLSEALKDLGTAHRKITRLSVHVNLPHHASRAGSRHSPVHATSVDANADAYTHAQALSDSLVPLTERESRGGVERGRGRGRERGRGSWSGRGRAENVAPSVGATPREPSAGAAPRSLSVGKTRQNMMNGTVESLSKPMPEVAPSNKLKMPALPTKK